MDITRARQLNSENVRNGKCVVYWMSRDQRVQDNWALLTAQEWAEKHQVPLVVIFALTTDFTGATLRCYDFMLRGLKEVEDKLRCIGIPFFLLRGKMDVTGLLQDQMRRLEPLVVVTDFSPLKVGRIWRDALAKKLNCPLIEVDAHNIVPAWAISDHQEFAAHTLRPKIARILGTYLNEFPKIKIQNVKFDMEPMQWSLDEVLDSLSVDRNVGIVESIASGEDTAHLKLKQFVSKKLVMYQENRNDPTKDGQSNLSAYLHFGQLSAQRVAMEIIKFTGAKLQEKLAAVNNSAEAYLEELIVRRELADNFCLYNHNYDNLKGAPEWAQKSLEAHRADHRPITYSKNEMEKAQTADPLWNTAQREMVMEGKMHGYMRMYWAKKILEWSETPEQAIETAIELNDKYELDGRDPNGYAGILWSIAGLHDRPWFEREIFGQIRYMNTAGLQKKFDTKKYTQKA